MTTRSPDDGTTRRYDDGTILSQLAAIGVRQVTDVLATHHHRDQVQGLHCAVEAGARVWDPYAVDLTIGDRRVGQAVEALVPVGPPYPSTAGWGG